MSALAVASIIAHPAQRFVASAKAGTWLVAFRRRVVFRADIIEQDGVGLLMPIDSNLMGLIFPPLCIGAVFIGALLGWLS